MLFRSQGVIEQATLDQKRLQSAIGVYQSRTAMSPVDSADLYTILSMYESDHLHCSARGPGSNNG